MTIMPQLDADLPLAISMLERGLALGTHDAGRIRPPTPEMADALMLEFERMKIINEQGDEP